MTSRELVINKGLTGEETKQLIRRDFEKLLSNEGLLSPHVAYGRIGWKIKLTLQMPNPMMPESVSTIDSRAEGQNHLKDSPQLASVEPLPLKPAPEDGSVVSATEVSHVVESPNLERVNAGLPVPLHVKQNDGSVIQENVVYPAPDPEQFPPPNVEITDVSDQARSELKV